VNRQVRWRGAVVAALGATVLGIGVGADLLLVLGAVAVGVVAVGYASAAPGGDLRVERSLGDDRPSPGAPVTVSLTIANESDRIQPDVRVVDEPPEDVAVVDGVPAVATALAPGESVTHEYEIAPPRGDHAFGQPTVRRRNLAATVVRTESIEPEGTRGFTCETLLDSFPLREQTIRFVGQSPTDDGGSGIEFYATREYRPGDPINRIDWHRLARTGELATVEYREERAVTVVFLIDDRAGAHVAPRGGGPDSLDLTLYAASRGVAASMDGGNRTGVATLSGDAWVDPGTDEGTRQRAEDAVDRVSDGVRRASTGGTVFGDGVATDGGETTAGGLRGDDAETTAAVHRLAERLPPNAQVVFCTPLTDDGAVAAARRLTALGSDVTVLSPDATTSVAERTATFGVEVEERWRESRVAELRSYDAAVIDWSLDEPIPVELQRLLRRWGRDR